MLNGGSERGSRGFNSTINIQHSPCRFSLFTLHPSLFGYRAAMHRILPFAFLLLVLPLHAQQEPDYSAWNHLLQTYYDPAHGMAYGQLKAHDAKALEALK